MDPISIVGLIGSVVSIGDVVAKSIRKLSDLRSRYHNAPFQITTLVGQLYIIQAAVGQLTQWKSSAFLNESRYLELASQIEASLDSFCPLILALGKYLDKFETVSDCDSFHTQNKLQYMWNEKDIYVYLSMVDRQSKVGQNDSQAILASARDCTSSIAGLGDHRTSVYSDNTNALSIQFDFDAVILGSRVYQTAHRSHLRQAIKASRPDGSVYPVEAPFENGSEMLLGPIQEESGESTNSDWSNGRVPLRSKVSPAVRPGQGFHPGSWLEVTPWRSRRKSMPQKQTHLVEQKPDDKILILGASQSGKTTLLKRIQYFLDEEPTKEERAVWADTIRAHVIHETLMALDFMKEDGTLLQYPDINKPHIATLRNNERCELRNVEAAIFSLWKDKVFLEGFHWSYRTQPANIKQLADRISSLADSATTQDILQVFVRTTGVHEISMYYNYRSFQICDVGGNRSQRRKWIHAFPNASVIIFTADATSYSKVLCEDEDVVRVAEELTLFGSIAEDRRFANNRLVLMLTHMDHLTDILVRVPVTDCFPDFISSHLPSSSDYQRDYLAYLENQFSSRIPDTRDRKTFQILRVDLIHDRLEDVESILQTLLKIRSHTTFDQAYSKYSDSLNVMVDTVIEIKHEARTRE
ncbi:unnamed protein product [Clonostachys rhizophaga]|uniref:G-protein alpha subunit-domain-containing protein n=1 Tax=Clonostachys rhizophaga TaxID=160324 RepID=A0A9N9V8K5_9HYPO|nr:unnamed protein product [Clonostachys rhizophaga]